MGKRSHEKVIFEAFLRAVPFFAGEAIREWMQPSDESDFPDVTCVAMSGGRIGVELGEWLHEKEMRAAKSKAWMERSFLAAIGDQGRNTTKHIYFVRLMPMLTARIHPHDGPEFRRQLFDLIGHVDTQWQTKPHWQNPQGCCMPQDELRRYAVLAKYLACVQLLPRAANTPKEWPAGVDWITFPLHVDSYDKSTMLTPLLDLLSDKTAHYASSGHGYQHLAFVAYYNRALLYNSPIEAPGWGFDGVVAEARGAVAGKPSPFHSIWIFHATELSRAERVL